MKLWMSWYEPFDPRAEHDFRPLVWPLPPSVLGYWCSGESDDAHTLCALVDAESEDAAKSIIYDCWPPPRGRRWRFCHPHPEPLGDRFPIPEWSPLHRGSAKEQASA